MTTAKVTKQEWVEMFKAIGLDEPTMDRWHVEFEARNPEGHQAFLEFINIPADEIATIRAKYSK